MSPLSPDAKAVVRAVDALTTQVRRLADTLSTPRVIDLNGTRTTRDDDSTTPVACPLCPSLRYFTGPADATDHFRTAHPEQQLVDGPWPMLVPPDGTLSTPATEADDAPTTANDDASAACRIMETRTCPTSYAGECGDRPCARFESDDPAPWTDQAPADDEEALRTARRDQLGLLLSRAGRGVLTPDEATLLRQHVETEMRDADTARARAEQAEDLLHVAHETSNRSEAERAAAVAELERMRGLLTAEHKRANDAIDRETRAEEAAEEARAERDAADRARAEAQRDRDQHAVTLAEVLHSFAKVLSDDKQRVIGFMGPTADPDTFERWRSVIAPTVERPWWEQLAEVRAELEQAQAVIERVRAECDRLETAVRANPTAPDFDGAYLAAVRHVRAALDGTEQTATE